MQSICKPHRVARNPFEDLPPGLLLHGDMAVEFDRVPHIQALYLPGIAKIEPVVRLLMLEAIDDRLQCNTLRKSILRTHEQSGSCLVLCTRL